MDTPEAEQLLGELKGSAQLIQGTVNRILDGQEEARRELLAMEQRSLAKLEKHAGEDVVNFGRVLERIETLHDRVGKMEGMADSVDSHTDAINSVERRLNQMENDDKLQAAVRINVDQNNVRWQRGIVGAATVVGAAAGSAGTTVGPKLWKVLIALLGGSK